MEEKKGFTVKVREIQLSDLCVTHISSKDRQVSEGGLKKSCLGTHSCTWLRKTVVPCVGRHYDLGSDLISLMIVF